MFAERFDAVMNIAEVSNSLLGRHVHMNPSYIGRLRSGARPLPKKHEYLAAMCRYLAGHIKKEYQINALQKLTGIDSVALVSPESTALYLEQWLLASAQDNSAAAGRLISGFSRFPSKPGGFYENETEREISQKIAPCLYGNAGKRKAVEQFFGMILQEEKPQTLLLFSDENMAWLYEDAAFAARWADFFLKVMLKGNRVKIIHTVSRDMNEMLEAVTKWVPIYMTGMIEPYYYPRLKDGIFKHTFFIAPNTAAILSSSVHQDTEGMLNLFITDKAALQALATEYGHYLSLCRPLMHIYTEKDTAKLQRASETLIEATGDAYFCTAMPPLFTMPEKLVLELSGQDGNAGLYEKWRQSLAKFEKNIKTQQLTLVLADPANISAMPGQCCPFTGEFFTVGNLSYTPEQYAVHRTWLQQMEKEFEHLKVYDVSTLADHVTLYIKENTGVILTKSSMPQSAFVITEKTMVSAFWDYTEKCLIGVGR